MVEAAEPCETVGEKGGWLQGALRQQEQSKGKEARWSRAGSKGESWCEGQQ